MSLNPVPLKIFRCDDPVTKVNNEREYGVMKGGQEVFYYPFPTSGNANASVNTINANPTNQRTIIDSKIFLLTNFTLAFNGTGATGGLLQAGYDAPRANPLSKCIKNLGIQLGDQQINTNLNEYFSVFERYSSDMDMQNHDYSESPAMPDQYADYSTGVQANNSELASYGFNPVQVPRGFSSGSTGSVWYNISQGSTGAGATATVNLTICEPMYLSPLYFGRHEKSGLIGIQSMVITVQFDNLTRLWSHATNSPSVISFPTGLNVTVNSLYALVKQVTPDTLMKIPPIIPYAYSQITPYASGIATSIASGAQATLVSGSITLNSIPSRIYVFARRQNSDLSATSTDTFGVLNNITIQLGTRQLLSSATQQDLYNMSVRNGCNLSWKQWAQVTGGPLAIDLSKDIGLMPTEAPSLLTRSSLVINANFTNPSLNSVNYVMYVLICEEGTVTIDNGHLIKQVGVLTQADILAAENAPTLPYRNERNVYGGAWWDDAFSGFKNVVNYVGDKLKNVGTNVIGDPKKALDTAKTIYEVGQIARPFLGLGMSGGNQAQLDEYVTDAIQGGRRKRGPAKKPKKGKGLVGGRMIDRDEL